MPIPRERLQEALRDGAVRVLDLLGQRPEQALSFRELAERLALDERQVSGIALALAQRGILDVSLVEGAFYCALSDKALQQGDDATGPALRNDPDTLRYIG